MGPKFLLSILFLSMHFFTFASEDLSCLNLDSYLKAKNEFIYEGYVTEKQKNELINDLKRAPKIDRIMEIGFNAGHSSEFFLSNTNCKKLVSFDIGIHPYLKSGHEFICQKYGGRFSLVLGDSIKSIPEYITIHPEEKFDVIFIDGGHTFECCYADILNCRQLAHRDTIVLIDDYVADVETAVQVCIQNGILVLLDYKMTEDIYIPNINGGGRTWVVVKYLVD